MLRRYQLGYKVRYFQFQGPAISNKMVRPAVCIDYKNDDEQAFGKPLVIEDGTGTRDPFYKNQNRKLTGSVT